MGKQPGNTWRQIGDGAAHVPMSPPLGAWLMETILPNLGAHAPGYQMPPLRGWDRATGGAVGSWPPGLTPPGYQMPLRGRDSDRGPPVVLSSTCHVSRLPMSNVAQHQKAPAS